MFISLFKKGVYLGKFFYFFVFIPFFLRYFYVIIENFWPFVPTSRSVNRHFSAFSMKYFYLPQKIYFKYI